MWVHGCVHLSARIGVRVCVSVFIHLCLCVSKGVYAVHCHAHFPLLFLTSCQTICSLSRVHMLYSSSMLIGVNACSPLCVHCM